MMQADRSRLLSLAVGLCVALAGCSAEEPSETEDAGSPTDSGTQSGGDAGSPTDSGTPGDEDAGTSADAGFAGAFAAGENFSLTLKDDGTVWAWGSNYFGQLGDGTTTPRLAPTQVPGFTGVVALSAGRVHSLALKADGTVWGWGLEDGKADRRSSPTQVPGLTGMGALAAGAVSSLAVAPDGSVWAWDSNLYGQFGNGSYGLRLFPVQVR